jgi:restriction endonuclease S subunit
MYYQVPIELNPFNEIKYKQYSTHSKNNESTSNTFVPNTNAINHVRPTISEYSQWSSSFCMQSRICILNYQKFILGNSITLVSKHVTILTTLILFRLPQKGQTRKV